MSFVQSYFADIEKTLLALSGVVGNAGHSVIKGSAREGTVKLSSFGGILAARRHR